MSSLRIPLIIYFALAALTAVGSAGLALFGTNDRYYALSQYLPIFLLFFIILAPLANILHRRAFQTGGLYLSGVFLMFWITGVLAMFDIIDSSRWGTTFMIGMVAGIPAGVGLLFRKKHWGPPFAWTLCTLASIAAVIMLIPTWFDTFASGGSQKLLSIGASILIFGAIASMLLINVGCGDRRYFRWPAFFAAITAMVITIVDIAYEKEWNDTSLFSSRLCGIVAGTCAFINVLLMTRRTGLVSVCKAVGIAGIIGIGSCSIIAMIASYYDTQHPDDHLPQPVYEWTARALFACLFLAMGAILCQLLARTMLRLTKLPTSPANIHQLTLTCPNCNQPGSIPIKDGACAFCLLQFRITLIEPKCPKCDYLLINVTSDRCPECGQQLQRPAMSKATSQA